MSTVKEFPYKWIAKNCGNVDVESIRSSVNKIHLNEDDQHPLSSNRNSMNPKENPSFKKTASKSVSEVKRFIDPLSAFSTDNDLETFDTKIKSEFDEADAFDSTESSNSDSSSHDSFWRGLENEVMTEGQKFGGKIEIPSSLDYLLPKLDNSETESQLKTVASRLEHLGLSTQGLSKTHERHNPNLLNVKQFSAFIESANNHLAKLWKDDQRVVVVKLVIQAAKMLSEPDARILEFYPSLFFSLADVITYFGQLVYDRLVSKCPDLKINFTLSDVSDTAKELCKNWLYKVASIRELVPRMYVECSLLRCYRFSCNLEGYPALIERFVLTARGIGDPLVAAYARVYLIYVVQQAMMSTSPQLVRNVARQNYDEFLTVFKYVGENEARAFAPLRLQDYISAYSPAIRWFIAAQTVGLDAEDPKKDQILKKCFNEIDNLRHPGILLRHLLDASSKTLISDECTSLCKILTKCDDPAYPSHLLIRTFGEKLSECSTLMAMKHKSVRIGILNQCWKALMKIVNVANFLSAAPVIFRFCVDHFGAKEVDVLLGDVVRHLKVIKDSSQTKGFSDSDTTSITRILKTCLDLHRRDINGAKNSNLISTISSLTNFCSLLEALDSQYQVELVKEILKTFQDSRVSVEETGELMPTADSELVVYLSEILAKSVNALTIQDESRQISQLICCLLSDVDFLENYEQKLKFLTNCREKFSRLEVVQVFLIQNVLKMSEDIMKQVEGSKRKSKLRGFLQACIAFSFITIPSVTNVVTKLRLYLLTSQVGYHARCFAQAEECVQALLGVVHEVAKNHLENTNRMISDKEFRELQTFFVNDLVPSLVAFLISVPEIRPADSGSEILLISSVKSILNAAKTLIQDDQWALCTVYLQCLHSLSVAAWDTYPYHIGGLDANDTIYFDCKDVLVKPVNRLCSLILEQLLHRLDYFSETGNKDKSRILAINLLESMFRLCSFEDQGSRLPALALKLWKISLEHSGTSRVQQDKYHQRFIMYAKAFRGQELQKLVEKMKNLLS